MSINPQAVELNQAIESANPTVLNLLSQKGKGIFFPKQGILAQTADAKSCKINATIGSALEDDGEPMCLESIADNIKLEPRQVFPYAPSFGRPDIREKWREMILAKNPLLGNTPFSLPVVTCALTHGISMSALMFCDPDDEIVLPDQFWGNYRLTFSTGYDVKLNTFDTFTAQGTFNLEAFKNALAQGPVGKRIVLLNFPNNPTGYTPTDAEAREIQSILVGAAEEGNELVVICDDAYFGLVYENGIFRESIFALLADAHERILAVKLDGPTKEDYVWGFRVGFMTFACKQSSQAMYAALEAKVAGATRGNISNAPNLSQSLLLEAYNSEKYAAEKVEKFNTLKIRYDRIKSILSKHKEYRETMESLPFNSGYFMCLRMKGVDAEKTRQILLTEYSTGVIALGEYIRVAFSATPFDMLDELFENIYQATLKAKS